MKAHVIQDSRGRIIGTAPHAVEEVRTTLPGVPISEKEAEEEALQLEVVLEPLEGQTIHEVELPDELASLEGADLLKALSEYRLTVGKAKLVRRSE